MSNLGSRSEPRAISSRNPMDPQPRRTLSGDRRKTAAVPAGLVARELAEVPERRSL